MDFKNDTGKLKGSSEDINARGLQTIYLINATSMPQVTV
jgi:hypothetical protein